MPRVSFFSWFLVWNIPKLRIVYNMLKCDENWELDAALGTKVLDNLRQSKFPEWIVVFPEVNIWTKAASEMQRSQSEKYYLPVLDEILYPRFSGVFNVVSAVHSSPNTKFSKIYDISIMYKYEKHDDTNSKVIFTPSLLDIFSSEHPITIRVNVKVKLFTRMPSKRAKVEKYVENMWVEKNRTLAQMHSPT